MKHDDESLRKELKVVGENPNNGGFEPDPGTEKEIVGDEEIRPGMQGKTGFMDAVKRSGDASNNMAEKMIDYSAYDKEDPLQHPEKLSGEVNHQLAPGEKSFEEQLMQLGCVLEGDGKGDVTVTHPDHEGWAYVSKSALDHEDYLEIAKQVKDLEEKKLKAAEELDKGREKALTQIDAKVFLNQKFGIGKYCQEVGFKIYNTGFMHIKYALLGFNQMLEAWGFGEIRNEMLYINIFYATAGTPSGYRILPVRDCFIDMMPYMDFVEVCTEIEKDIAYMQTDEYKEKKQELTREAQQKKFDAELENKRIAKLQERADAQEQELAELKKHPWRNLWRSFKRETSDNE
jgi:hypothetical protein